MQHFIGAKEKKDLFFVIMIDKLVIMVIEELRKKKHTYIELNDKLHLLNDFFFFFFFCAFCNCMSNNRSAKIPFINLCVNNKYKINGEIKCYL